MEKSPAFQWYPKDFDTDENVILMTLEEIGAYVKLMNSEWLHKGLPMEDENLAIISRLGEKWFTGSGEKIKKCFKKKGKRLIHPRLEKERKKQQEWRLKSSNGGKKSASVRKESKKEPTTLAPPLREKVNQSSTLLSSSSSPSSTPVKTNTIIPGWINEELWIKFEQHRKDIKKPMTENARGLIIKKLERFKKSGQDINAVLSTSIENGWAGVFEEKGKYGKSKERVANESKRDYTKGLEDLDS